MPGKIDRMRIGTQSIAALSLLDAALDIWETVDMNDLRTTSIDLSETLIQAIEERCPDLTLASPRNPNQRGSHVAFEFEHGYSCIQALIAQGVVGDFRAPNIMRFGITPLFISLEDIRRAVTVLESILTSKSWDKSEFQTRALVT
tara:strand:- start:126 stop:560 length:435 start_codon:yes stop_codon:yes gene_type:complete